MADATPEPETIEKLGNAAFFSIAMVAGMQLELFTPLGSGPMTAEQLAEALGVGVTRLTPLLYALVAADLLTVEDGRFANTPEADHYLVRGKPTYMEGRHSWYTDRYHQALQTAETIRRDAAQTKIDFLSMSAEELEAFLRGFYFNTLRAGQHLATHYDFSSRRHLLDVGGGSGGVAMARATAYPRLRATVIDLPTVTPITQRFIQEGDLADRVEALAGDVVHGPLTGTYDVAVLRSFIQVLSRDDAQRALHNLSQILEPGSPIYIVGQVLDDSHLSPVESVVSNIFFINIYDEGQAYTYGEHRDWLTRAGFTDIDRVIQTGGTSSITAHKPSYRRVFGSAET
jgi:hypothetical protein